MSTIKSDTDAAIADDPSKQEGVFTVTQVLPVAAEEELGASGEGADEGDPPLAEDDDDEEGAQARTYQLGPTVAVSPTTLQATVDRVLREHLSPVKEAYDPEQMRDSIAKISSAVRDELRGCGGGRFRIVCQVSAGEKCDQDVFSSFLCLWRHEFDHYAVATFEAEKFFATAVVFVVYKQ